MPAPKQTDPQFKLRMPQSLKDSLDDAVAKSGRTLNAEILYRLQSTFHGATVTLPTDMRRRIETAARLNQRDFPGELFHALNTAYPPPAPDDFSKMREIWDALMGGMPDEKRDEAAAQLKELIKKNFPDGADYVDDLESRDDEDY